MKHHTMSFLRANAHAETGSALLLCLGILSLVLVLAMGFAYTANTSISVAKARAQATGARTLADGCVDAVLGDIRLMSDKTQEGSTANPYYPPVFWEAGNASLNQSALAFKTFSNIDGVNAYTQRYMLSTDLDKVTTENDPTTLSNIFKLNTTGADAPAYLPQLKYMTSNGTTAGSFSGTGLVATELKFAYPVLMNYTMTDEDFNHHQKENLPVARYAYIILEEANKLDINAIVSSHGRPPQTRNTESDGADELIPITYDRLLRPIDVDHDATNAYSFNIFASGKIPAANATYKEGDTIRLGLLPEEIQALDTNETTGFSNYIEKQPSTSESGVHTGWLSYNHLVGTADTPYTGKSNLFLYNLFGAEDIEAYWDKDNTTERQRLDITGYAWSATKPLQTRASMTFGAPANFPWNVPTTASAKLTLAQNLAGYSGLETAPDTSTKPVAAFWNNAKTDEIKKFWAEPENVAAYEEAINDVGSTLGSTTGLYIDWLHRMKDADGEDLGVQVAANIVDYSDTDSFATHSIAETAADGKTSLKPTKEGSETDYSFKEPLVFGNERVAYFTKVGFQSQTWKEKQTASQRADKSAGYYDYKTTLWVPIQLLNIYGCDSCTVDQAVHTGTDCNDVKTGHVRVRVKGYVHVYEKPCVYAPIGSNMETWQWNTTENCITVVAGGTTYYGEAGVQKPKRFFYGEKDPGTGLRTEYTGTGIFYPDPTLPITEISALKFPIQLHENSLTAEQIASVTTAKGLPVTDDTCFLEFNDKANSCFELQSDTSETYDIKTKHKHLGAQNAYLRLQLDQGDGRLIPWTRLGSGTLATLYDKLGKTVPTGLDASLCTNFFEAQGETAQYLFSFEIQQVEAFTYDETAAVDASDATVLEKLYDFAVTEPPASSEDTDFNSAPSATLYTDTCPSGHKTWAKFEIKNDPRLNHRETQWTRTKSTTGDGLDLAMATVAGTYTHSTDQDKETGIKFYTIGSSATDQRSYSTAYIPNAPMKTLWELGAIHRGEVNRTINLCDFCEPGDADAGKYTAGDAILLDQLKIGPLLFVRGKINANQRNPHLFARLFDDPGFENIWYDTTATARKALGFFPGENTTKIEDALDELGKATTWNGLAYLAPSQYRARFTELINDVVDSKNIDNDREREMFIGRTAQLLTTRTDAYSMILYAEKLEPMLNINAGNYGDMRNVYPTLFKMTITLKGGSTVDRYVRVVGRQKVLVHFIRDAWRNKLRIIKKQYLDDYDL